jgi:hypothetical protein
VSASTTPSTSHADAASLTPSPAYLADAEWLRDWWRSATQRVVRVHAVRDATTTLAWALVPAAVLTWWGVPWSVLVLLLGSLVVGSVWRAKAAVARDGGAHEVESRVLESRNLLVTARQLIRDSADPPAVMTGVVLHRARALASGVDVRSLLPVPWGAAFGMLLALGLSQSLVHRVVRQDGVRLALDRRADRREPGAFDATVASITVRPPAYLGQADSVVRAPTRVQVPEGATLLLQLASADADSVVLETQTARLAAQPDSADRTRWAVRWPARDDDVLAITAYRGEQTAHALVGLSVVRDADPRVRITAPGRDLVLPRADTTLRLAITADDDHALGLLQLRYTKVSGSGERYEFEEGELPLAIRRRSAAEWEAELVWSLRSLALGPGDVLVYKAVTADRRPGAPLVESDAWIAEVPTGRGDGAEGFAVDVGETRYALSQQMVVLRIERLIAARDSLGSAMRDESFAGLARSIAVEQRRVRAEFVFLMGGELSEEVTAENSMGDLDEHQHAEVEADLSAGRVRNEGREAVFAAIRAMSRAATALSDTAMRPALQQAKLAVVQLEVAFSKARFLMRPLSTREAIDQSRRLSGSLVGITSAVQAVRAWTPSDVAATRTAVLRALVSADTVGVASAWPRHASTLLRRAPGDARAQAIALALNDAALAWRRGDARAAAAARDSAVLQLQRWERAEAPDATGGSRTPRDAAFDAAVERAARSARSTTDASPRVTNPLSGTTPRANRERP